MGPAIERARTHSPFLRFHLEKKNPVAAAIEAGNLPGALAQARAEGEGDDVMAALRRERSGHALALAIGDLAGLLTLEQVTLELSRLADRTLE
ncbi:MAG TPA: hypothetical protein VGC46_12540, partial [Allosphingosinicella sp.]